MVEFPFASGRSCLLRGGEGLLLMAQTRVSSDKKEEFSMQQTLADQAIQDCIQLCQDCHAVCETTAIHCLRLGGSHAELAHQRLLRDCAQICQTSADFMLRRSPLHTSVCGLCAQICLQCAQSCEQIGTGDAQMKACADLCRRCAQSCQRMEQARF